MLIIGIDPGISGSLCFFEDGKIIDLVEMPSMAEGKKNKRQVNGAQIYNEIFSRIKNFISFSFAFFIILLKVHVDGTNKPKFNLLLILYRSLRFFSLNEISPYFFKVLTSLVSLSKFDLENTGFISNIK